MFAVFISTLVLYIGKQNSLNKYCMEAYTQLQKRRQGWALAKWISRGSKLYYLKLRAGSHGCWKRVQSEWRGAGGGLQSSSGSGKYNFSFGGERISYLKPIRPNTPKNHVTRIPLNKQALFNAFFFQQRLLFLTYYREYFLFQKCVYCFNFHYQRGTYYLWI